MQNICNIIQHIFNIIEPWLGIIFTSTGLQTIISICSVYIAWIAYQQSMKKPLISLSLDNDNRILKNVGDTHLSDCRVMLSDIRFHKSRIGDTDNSHLEYDIFEDLYNKIINNEVLFIGTVMKNESISINNFLLGKIGNSESYSIVSDIDKIYKLRLDCQKEFEEQIEATYLEGLHLSDNEIATMNEDRAFRKGAEIEDKEKRIWMIKGIKKIHIKVTGNNYDEELTYTR